MIDLMVDGVFLSRRKARMTTGGTAFNHQFPTYGKNWLRITRVGNQFAAYHSLDGNSWEVVFSTQIPMGNCIQVGLVTQNATPTGQMIGVFENVAVSSSSGALASLPTDLETNTLLEAQSKDFNVFPNPAREVVNIDLGQFLEEEVQISVYNHQGQLIQQRDWSTVQNSIEQFNITDLTSGTYIIEVLAGDQRISKKLIKTDW